MQSAGLPFEMRDDLEVGRVQTTLLLPIPPSRYSRSVGEEGGHLSAPVPHLIGVGRVLVGAVGEEIGEQLG